MLTLQVGAGVGKHALVHRVRTPHERAEQSAGSDDGGQLSHITGSPAVNSLPAEFQLIPQLPAGTEIGGVMAEHVTRNLGLFLKQSNLGCR